MIIECDAFEFNFTDALSAIKFDEQDRNSENFHGFSHGMKAIDIIAEVPQGYLFVEIKRFYEPDSI